MTTRAPFTVAPARYAKGMLAVRPTTIVAGLKGRCGELCDALRARYSNREEAYIMSPRKVEHLRALYFAPIETTVSAFNRALTDLKRALRCPNCGGALRTANVAGRLTCAACGHTCREETWCTVDLGSVDGHDAFPCAEQQCKGGRLNEGRYVVQIGDRWHGFDPSTKLQAILWTDDSVKQQRRIRWLCFHCHTIMPLGSYD